MEKEYTTVVVDAMGGDNAPDAMIQGAVDAITKNAAVQVILVGREEVIAPKLEAYTFDKARIRIVNASEEISCDEPPVRTERRTPSSPPEVPEPYWSAVGLLSAVSAASTAHRSQPSSPQITASPSSSTAEPT